MQNGSDYQRGYEAALSDAKSGWALCWLPARQLAEDAVYGPNGLTEEQKGYAAGLDECFPGGVAQAPNYMGKPLPTLGFEYSAQQTPPPVASQQPPVRLPSFEADKLCAQPCRTTAPGATAGVAGEKKKNWRQRKKGF